MPFPSVVPSEIWSVRTNNLDGLNRKRRGEMPPLHNPKTNMQNAAITGQYVSRRIGAAFRISGGNKWWFLTGSGSRWVPSPWLRVLVSSLQAALANACTSAMSRHACQPGMWWHSTIPLANYPAWREVSRDKRDGIWKDFQNERVEKKEKKRARTLVLVILTTACIMPRITGAFGFIKATRSLSRTEDDRTLRGR